MDDALDSEAPSIDSVSMAASTLVSPPRCSHNESEYERPAELAPGMWEVEKIVDMEKRGRSLYWEVKWKSYPDSENT